MNPPITLANTNTMDNTYILNDNDCKDIFHLMSLFDNFNLKPKSNKQKSNKMETVCNCKIIVPYDFTYDTIIKKIHEILNNNIKI